MVITKADWQRLGKLLRIRRTELGWPNRTKFARDHGLSHQRTLIDIEGGKRDNYEAGTITHIEVLYRWAPGSIERVLSGGEPVPVPDHPADLPEPGSLRFTRPAGLTDEQWADLSAKMQADYAFYLRTMGR